MARKPRNPDAPKRERKPVVFVILNDDGTYQLFEDAPGPELRKRVKEQLAITGGVANWIIRGVKLTPKVQTKLTF